MDATSIPSQAFVQATRSERTRRDETIGGLKQFDRLQLEVSPAAEATRLPPPPSPDEQPGLAEFAESFFGVELPSTATSARQGSPPPVAARGSEKGIDREAENRLKLLARKHLDQTGLSREQEARLTLITEKLRRLVPRVSHQEMDTLQQVAEQLEEIDARSARLLAELDAEDNGG